MKTDGGLYDEFRRHVRGHWTRIESGWTSAGVPDAHYCVGGASGWVEFKLEKSGRVTIRTLQSSFAESYASAGGRSLLAVRTKGGLSIYGAGAMRALLLDPRSTPVRGGRSCRTEAAEPYLLYRGEGRPAEWDWERVTRVLTK